MIRHLFTWRVTDASTNAEVLARLSALMTDAPEPVAWTLGGHVGDPGARAWDGVLTCDFTSHDELRGFLGSPAHREVVGGIGPGLADVALVDYEVDPA